MSDTFTGETYNTLCTDAEEYLAKDSPEQARELLQKAISLIATRPRARSILANACMSMELWSEARSQLEVLLTLDEGNIGNNFKLAQVLEELGEYQLAKDNYTVVLDDEPDNHNAKVAIKRIETRTKDSWINLTDIFDTSQDSDSEEVGVVDKKDEFKDGMQVFPDVPSEGLFADSEEDEEESVERLLKNIGLSGDSVEDEEDASELLENIGVSTSKTLQSAFANSEDIDGTEEKRKHPVTSLEEIFGTSTVLKEEVTEVEPEPEFEEPEEPEEEVKLEVEPEPEPEPELEEPEEEEGTSPFIPGSGEKDEAESFSFASGKTLEAIFNTPEPEEEKAEPEAEEPEEEKAEPEAEEPVVEEAEPEAEEPEEEKAEPEAEEPEEEKAEPEAEEPVVEEAEPEAEEPEEEKAEPEAEEPEEEKAEPEAEEPVVEEAEPEAEEPEEEKAEPEAEEPVVEEVEPEAEEPVVEEVEPEAEEPVVEEVEPEAEEPEEDVTEEKEIVTAILKQEADLSIDPWSRESRLLTVHMKSGIARVLYTMLTIYEKAMKVEQSEDDILELSGVGTFLLNCGAEEPLILELKENMVIRKDAVAFHTGSIALELLDIPENDSLYVIKEENREKVVFLADHPTRVILLGGNNRVFYVKTSSIIATDPEILLAKPVHPEGYTEITGLGKVYLIE